MATHSHTSMADVVPASRCSAGSNIFAFPVDEEEVSFLVTFTTSIAVITKYFNSKNKSHLTYLVVVIQMVPDVSFDFDGGWYVLCTGPGFIIIFFFYHQPAAVVSNSTTTYLFFRVFWHPTVSHHTS